MKQPQILFRTLTPVEDVLEAFLATGKKMSGRIAMEACKQLVEGMVKDRAAKLIIPELINAYDSTVFTTGINPLIAEGDELEAWTDAMDDTIEALLDMYSLSVTQDFIGRYCVSTRFHLPTTTGAKSEAQVLAEAFAADVWRVLIHDSDEDAEPPRILSTAKILAAVGITQSDLQEIMGDMPATAPQVQPKEVNMLDMNTILNQLHEFYGGEFDEAEVKGFFEMAIDNDEGLSLSGLVPMGLDSDAAPTLRLFAAKYGKDAPDEFVQAMHFAPYDVNTLGYPLSQPEPDVQIEIDTGAAVGNEFPNGEDEETDPELREMMGLAPLPAAASPVAPPRPPAPAPAAPPKTPVAPPAAAGGPPGTIPKEVFALIRQHVKIKDEDIAAGIGVSRQTFINYADPKKAATLTASDAQRAFLMQTIEDAMQGLLDARNLLDGNA